MLIHDLQGYIDAVSKNSEIGVAVHSIETDEEIAVSYAVVADINEYGELILIIAIESGFCKAY